MVRNILKSVAILLVMAFSVQFAQAQSSSIRMTNGTREVNVSGTTYINFYDSGGDVLYDPVTDPTNANEYNWTTWYQHYEEYTLTLTVPDGKGIRIEFEKLLINNDSLSFYEGNYVSEGQLIGTFTNNDYSTALCSASNPMIVESHGNMTIRFTSDWHWRDEGWVAKIYQTDAFTPRPPVAVMAACSNQMMLLPTCKVADAVMQYKIGSGAFTNYTPNSWVDLTFSTGVNTLTITTQTKIGENTSATSTYALQEVKAPGEPDYTPRPTANSIITFFPDKNGANDTYYIRWTINNNPNTSNTENPLLWEANGHEVQQPNNTPNSVPADTIDYTNITLSKPFYIHLATRGTTCPDIFSGVITYEVEKIYVPEPTITFETNTNNTGKTTLTCGLSGATIYYTLDGSTPNPDQVGGTYPTTLYSAPFNVAAGTTVKAIAVKTNYTNSPMASEIFIPGAESGNGQNGVYGNIVLLDDREGHDWSYYSDDSQPIHKLNPADVKITYFGYGENTMTTTSTADEPLASAFDGTVLASQVAVGPSDPGNQFIYLKTLENAEDDGSGTYPYTLIPNPFSVRPAFEGTAATTRTIVIVTSRSPNQNSGWDRNPPATLTVACNGTTLATINSRTTTTINNVPVGGEVTLTFNGVTGNNASTYNGRCRIAVYYDAANTSPTIFDEYNPTSTGMETRSFTVATPAAQKDYRGFYAWRVKRLSDDLYIQRANGTTVGEGAIIPAEEEIQFIATNAKGNEVEFEALWAKAYVVTSNTTTGLNANVSYERNFVVGATPSALNMPITYSSYYPDGEFRANSSVNDFTCQNNTKFEYMTISGGTFTANNHDLVMGRGLTGTATLLQGISGNAAALNYTLRVESGTYTQLAFVRAQTGTTVSGLYLIKAIMGCDYDRANNEDNSKLSVSPSNQLFFSTGVTYSGSGNKDQKTFDCVFKSGSYQSSYWGANVNNNGDYQHSAYLGQNSAGNTYPGMRFVTVEGGEFGSICGGRGVGGESTTYASPEVVTFDLRIKGGLLHGCVYGAAADNPSIGSRRIVITGGEIRSWVAAGCNGTGSTSGTGATNGDSYVYVGGDAVIGGNNASVINGTAGGQVFGAGRGLEGRAGSINTSNVVIADNANISNPGTTGVLGGNVYGGGFNSYIVNVSNVYIVGGTIQRSVFGGSYGNGTAIPTSNVYIKGGIVNGSVYGGSNNTGTITNSNVTMTGGETKNVFGGGYGTSTNMAAGTKVNVSGGTINNNVYGGGEEGTVSVGTNVSISGGTMKNVFGAGKGATGVTALVSGPTSVAISGGTMDNVYGGGEAGNVAYTTATASTVTVQGGTVNEDVFGGGRMGKTTGNVVVNVFGGDITGNVYGGAFGRRDEVFVEGTHTVNVTGGNIYSNVYGGSRNANDALTASPTGGETDAVNRVNISGGHVYYQVFAGGYFGHTYGSVYAFIGQNAINNAPNAAPTTGVGYSSAALIIEGSVWAGADFGNFNGTEFGAHTIEGYSNVYIDGTGYNTVSTKPSDAGYMIIGTSVLGSGTSCYAGKEGSNLIFREYGQPVLNPSYSKEAIVEKYLTATRELMSLQFFDYVDIDNAHLQLVGQGRINSLTSTENYSVYEVKDRLRMVNGSSVFIDAPMDQMKSVGSYTCGNVYATTPTYSVVDYSDLPNAGKDNKFRVNNGSYLNVKYVGAYGTTSTGLSKDYGELIGYFYMMTDDENNTCAYARPKQSKDQGNQIPTGYDNPTDGGFLSYHSDQNTYTYGKLTLSGEVYIFAQIADAPGTYSLEHPEDPGVQMPYENHTLTTKNGEQYFRIWRYGGILSYREGVLTAVAKTTAGYSTTDVVISLPAQHGTGSYFRIKKNGSFPMIDYGDDILTVNAGIYDTVNNTSKWMYYDKDNSAYVINQAQTATAMSSALTLLDQNPNVNFGLVAIPQGSLNGGTNQNWLLCNDAGDDGEILSSAVWTNNDNVTNPSITFRLTYNNQLTNNATWDPIVIVLEQCDANGNVKDEITIALSISMVTTINQEFGGQAFAMMNGSGTQASTFTTKVVLPGFIPYVNTVGDLSNWTFVEANWTAAESDFNNAWQKGSDYITNPYSNNKFSMQIVPAANFDNTVGWSTYEHSAKDLKNITSGTHLAYTDGRNPTAFDFILHYDGRATCDDTKKKMGELEVKLHFTNIDNGTTTHEQDLIITIEIYRRGKAAYFFLDGVNGDNFFSGMQPNSAKKTLSGIYNRTTPAFTPGDIIFVVNTVTAGGASALDWNGEQYGEVVIYRYPGGHAKNASTDPSEVYVDYDTYNPENKGFTGPLVNVKNAMNIHGIVLDGAYDIAKGHPNSSLAPVPAKYQTPTSPLINIESTGVLNVYAHSKLQWNWTSSNGGGVYNAGRMTIRNGSDINYNAVLAEGFKGAGVFVKDGAKLIVSDSITIDTNFRRFESGSKATVEKNSNVYLEGENSVIQVGTSNPSDAIVALSKSAKIGVSKSAWPDYFYNPIAYSDGGGSVYLGNIIPANPDLANSDDYLIYDDDHYYKLVTLNNTSPYEPSTDYLFWVGTWVTKVRTRPDTYSTVVIDENTVFDEIHNANDLAWAISVVNGLNGETAQPDRDFKVLADIDMSANIWVPMGIDASGKQYSGNFNANGHVVKGIKSSLNEENMGMFGAIGLKGVVENMILNTSFTGGNSVRMGALAAVMENATIKNVETAGVLTGTSSTTDMGGMVGEKRGGTIQSSFAVNTMTTTNDKTRMGGLVGSNVGNLYNSYANTTMIGSDTIGGLAGVNKGTIENCYTVVNHQNFPAFAYKNKGTIQYCYADEDNYVEDGTAPSGHGQYGEVKDRKAIGYMYNDNDMNDVLNNWTDNDNPHPYVTDVIKYQDTLYIDAWNGLLSALNQWVAIDPQNIKATPWFRPTSGNINGDLPVLAFPSDNCLGTTDADGKFLEYGSTYNNANGLDQLLEKFNGIEGDPTSSLFLYGNASKVKYVPEDQVKVFLNENTVLLQESSSKAIADFKAVVGVTFDNSHGKAHDYSQAVLTYDWHMFSSPLKDAKMGTTYSKTDTDGSTYIPDAWSETNNAIFQTSPGDIASMVDSYFPNGLTDQSEITWDFYNYFEPEYHWINLKRNKKNHFHRESVEFEIIEGKPYQLDEGGADYRHYQINYTGDDQADTKATSGDDGCVFTPGKGYLMAISQDSYLSSTGTLQNGTVTIPITALAPTSVEGTTESTDKGSNLLGNPYHAYLDMTEFFTVNTRLNSSYWVYIAEADNYVAGNCSASDNWALPSGTLHPHQGFFVVTSEDATATFNYDMATDNPQTYSYFRGKVNYPLVNLFATNQVGQKDLVVIETNRPEFGGSTKLRALNNTGFELFARTGGSDYSILFTEEGTDRVAVGFKTFEDGTYTLTWDTQNGKFKYLQLVDNITGGHCDMLTADHYTFESHPADMKTRFYVIFQTADDDNEEINNNFAFFNGSEWVINGKGTLQLIDVTGRILYSKNVSGETTARMNFENFAAGTYMLRLVGSNNTSKTQKIVIQ